jgi:hypothetical protein
MQLLHHGWLAAHQLLMFLSAPPARAAPMAYNVFCMRLLQGNRQYARACGRFLNWKLQLATLIAHLHLFSFRGGGSVLLTHTFYLPNTCSIAAHFRYRSRHCWQHTILGCFDICMHVAIGQLYSHETISRLDAVHLMLSILTSLVTLITGWPIVRCAWD